MLPKSTLHTRDGWEATQHPTRSGPDRITLVQHQKTISGKNRDPLTKVGAVPRRLLAEQLRSTTTSSIKSVASRVDFDFSRNCPLMAALQVKADSRLLSCATHKQRTRSERGGSRASGDLTRPHGRSLSSREGGVVGGIRACLAANVQSTHTQTPLPALPPAPSPWLVSDSLWQGLPHLSQAPAQEVVRRTNRSINVRVYPVHGR